MTTSLRLLGFCLLLAAGAAFVPASLALAVTGGSCGQWCVTGGMQTASLLAGMTGFAMIAVTLQFHPTRALSARGKRSIYRRRPDGKAEYPSATVR